MEVNRIIEFREILKRRDLAFDFTEPEQTNKYTSDTTKHRIPGIFEPISSLGMIYELKLSQLEFHLQIASLDSDRMSLRRTQGHNRTSVFIIRCDS